MLLGLWGSIWGGLETSLAAREEKLRNMSGLWPQMGGFGVLGAPLGLSGAPFCGPGQQKERPEVLNNDLGGIVTTSIFISIFAGF